MANNSLQELQIVSYSVDEIINTLEDSCPVAEKATKYQPDAASMQRSGNTHWMPVEQEVPTVEGWDLTGKENDILELSVKVNMGEPDNAFFSLRADNVRDESSLRHHIRAQTKKLANNIETSLLRTAAEMGSLVVHDPDQISTKAGGAWDFMAAANEMIFARELNRDSGLSYVFNPSDYRRAGYDLVGRDIYGRLTADAYKSGNIQKQIAGFDDVFQSAKLPTLHSSMATGLIVSGAQSFKPVAWIEDPDGNRENVDNRFAQIKLSGTGGLKRGDKISFSGVKFLSQMAKNVLTYDATFSVVRVLDNSTIEITPKPIALDDSNLTPTERAYANVNTGLASGIAVNIINVKDAAVNLFFPDDAIRIVTQPIPVNHKLFAGMRTESFSIPKIGVNGVFATQGDISTFAGKCRIALWYAPHATRPEAIGIGLPGQSV